MFDSNRLDRSIILTMNFHASDLSTTLFLWLQRLTSLYVFLNSGPGSVCQQGHGRGKSFRSFFVFRLPVSKR